MVAETHSHGDDVSIGDVVRFIAVDLGGHDPDTAGLERLTLGECGFEMTLDFVDLAHQLAEEFGERTLVNDDLEDIDTSAVLEDFATRLYPSLGPSPG